MPAPLSSRFQSDSPEHRTRGKSDEPSGFRELFLDAQSRAMRRCLELIGCFARHEDVLHLEGETGTGKSALFRQIVRCSSRRDRPTATVVISGLHDERVTTDLFGHVRGAYTGAVGTRRGRVAEADGGTLFLDEIGKASPAVQRHLLEFVETRRFYPTGADRAVEVDCRVVTASNVPLNDLVRSEGFLTDLRFRLQSLVVRVPSLRERREDIPDIVRFFVAMRANQDPVLRSAPRVHPELIELLASLEWPGNLRELSACIARLVAEHATEAELTPLHLESQRDLITFASQAPEQALERGDAQLRAAIAQNAGNIAKTARELGLHRSTLYRRLRGFETDEPSVA